VVPWFGQCLPAYEIQDLVSRRTPSASAFYVQIGCKNDVSKNGPKKTCSGSAPRVQKVEKGPKKVRKWPKMTEKVEKGRISPKKVKNWPKLVENGQKSRKTAKKVEISKSSKNVQKAPKTSKSWLIWSILPHFHPFSLCIWHIWAHLGPTAI
jgi:hypothetical protein